MKDSHRKTCGSLQPLDFALATESAVLAAQAVRESLRPEDEQTHDGDVIEGLRNGLIMGGYIWLGLMVVARAVFELL